MRKCNAALWLGLLLWAGPAGAQTVHSLTVSVHKGVQPALTQEDVELIVQTASGILANACNVQFKLDGKVGTFKTSAPSVITDDATLEAVHNEPADVKVVERIEYCVGQTDKNGYLGCSWRPGDRRPKTMIVAAMAGGFGIRPIVWAHEFGHTTGLQHRQDSRGMALMTPCGIKGFNKVVTDQECECFRGGRGSCNVPPSAADKCPAD